MPALLWIVLLCALSARGADLSTASNSFSFALSPPVAANTLLADSPFGINTAFNPSAPDLEARLQAMRQAGIKWGRQDFTWRRIEKSKGEFDWAGYDAPVEKCHEHGLLIFGNPTYNPPFYDLKTAAGVEAYAAFARAAVKRYAGKVDYWQIWNEPNLGYLGGDAEHYAKLLGAAGKAIHEANPNAKVLALNMAFCDVLWASNVMRRVPHDAFDIVCFHPYRNPNAPEDKFDWWVLDQYVKRFHPNLTTNYPLVRMSFLDQTGELIQAMQPLGEPKPLWVTEICFNTHIHPYGVSELRQADARAILRAGHGIAKDRQDFLVDAQDGGGQQFDAAEMVG